MLFLFIIDEGIINYFINIKFVEWINFWVKGKLSRSFIEDVWGYFSFYLFKDYLLGVFCRFDMII